MCYMFVDARVLVCMGNVAVLGKKPVVCVCAENKKSGKSKHLVVCHEEI